MVLGIDVGGTYTDAVLLSEKKILRTLKIPTNHLNLMESLGNVFRELEIPGKYLPEKIVVSTTLLTNFITEKRYRDTGLLLIPGPGMSYSKETFPFPWVQTSGGVDFQGRIIQQPIREEVFEKANELLSQGITRISVNCKFSPRNPQVEEQVVRWIQEAYPDIRVRGGLEQSGQLNMIRRAISSGLQLASEALYEDFLFQLEKMVPANSHCYILQSDGGILSLENAGDAAVTTLFSGPAASALGAMALLEHTTSAMIIDIGGTTSDYSLILDGEPLFSTKGVTINDFYTTARGISVYSLPIGGDTRIAARSDEELQYTGIRGIPAINGGNDLTLSDCLCYLGKISIGNFTLAATKIEEEAEKRNLAPVMLAEELVRKAARTIGETLEKVLHIWEQEPKYRVWQIANQQALHPEKICLLGGPAQALAPYLEEVTGLPVVIDSLAPTANALGAALARPGFYSQVRINTGKGETSCGWGYFEKNSFKGRIHPKETADYAVSLAADYLKRLGISDPPVVMEQEIFSMVRGGYLEGQIHEIAIGLLPGLDSRDYPLEREGVSI